MSEKPMQWFRLYSEIVDDEKLRLLAFEDRWHYVAILCCKSKGILEENGLEMMFRKVAVKLGLQVRELEESARRLSEVGLIEKDTLEPLGWNGRQFVSDSSTPRSRKSREEARKKKELEACNKGESSSNDDATLQERCSNAPETETDTEEEANASLSEPDKPVADRVDACPHQKIIGVYHEVLPELPGVIVSRWAASQGADHLRTRWREDQRHQSLDFWTAFFSTVRTSKHWMGGNDRGWKADLRWLLERRNFDKVLTQMVFNRQQEQAHG